MRIGAGDHGRSPRMMVSDTRRSDTSRDHGPVGIDARVGPHRPTRLVIVG